MFAPKTALLLAVLATAAPVLGYNPYAEEDGLYAREFDGEFDDLYVRDAEADDFEFEMQKREIIENYLVARDDLESLLYSRDAKNAGGSGVIGDEKTAIKDNKQTLGAMGKERGLQNKIKAEEKALKKTEGQSKAEKGTIRKDERKGAAAQNKVKGDLNGHHASHAGHSTSHGAAGHAKPMEKGAAKKAKGKRSLFDDLSFEW